MSKPDEQRLVTCNNQNHQLLFDKPHPRSAACVNPLAPAQPSAARERDNNSLSWHELAVRHERALKTVQADLARVTKERDALTKGERMLTPEAEQVVISHIGKTELRNGQIWMCIREEENGGLTWKPLMYVRDLVAQQEVLEATQYSLTDEIERREKVERERDQVRDATLEEAAKLAQELIGEAGGVARSILALKSKPTSHGSPKENGGTQPSASLLREKEIDHEPAPVKGEYSPEQGAEPGKEKA